MSADVTIICDGQWPGKPIMRDTPLNPHGLNWQWSHVRATSQNDAMLMRFRFRVGLSGQWPPSTYQPQN